MSFGSGIVVASFVVNSNTEITANIAISNGTTVGARSVMVITAFGQGMLASGFTVVAPLQEMWVNNINLSGKTLKVSVTDGIPMSGVVMTIRVTSHGHTWDKTAMTASSGIATVTLPGSKNNYFIQVISLSKPGYVWDKTKGIISYP